MAQLTQWFWRQEYWLPPGITWEDMQDTEDIRYPQPHHLLLCFPIALLLIALRFLFYRKIAIPLSKKLGLQEKVRRKPSPNLILEAFYTKWRKNPQKVKVSGLAKQCDLPTRQVERWFRYRLNQNRPSVTKKFCEWASKLEESSVGKGKSLKSINPLCSWILSESFGHREEETG
uniref:Homeobox domain-containing protein n=1 Tax=Naja naja TaxID=35670 RepID=A0A8C6VBJ1_NAJNA